jgi:hypothetical protein
MFARADGERQVLVYSMNVAVAGDVAMVLPLPIPAGLSEAEVEAAVELVALDGYPTLFDDLEAGFPVPVARGMGGRALFTQSRAPLVVHDVGDFEASLVPTRDDFDRLDDCFRLDPAVLDALTGYADWAFVVFQLRRPVSWFDRLRARWAVPASKTIHPMAMRFVRRDRQRLFFPTVHSHHGALPEQEVFDHSLVWQAPHLGASDGYDTAEPSRTVDIDRTKGLVHPDWWAKRTLRKGVYANGDHWLQPDGTFAIERPVSV